MMEPTKWAVKFKRKHLFCGALSCSEQTISDLLLIPVEPLSSAGKDLPGKFGKPMPRHGKVEKHVPQCPDDPDGKVSLYPTSDQELCERDASNVTSQQTVR